MCFKPKFEPALIDLDEYELALYDQRERRVARMLPSCIPHRMDRPWTDAELRAMKINRIRAKKLYREYTNHKQ